MGGERALFTFCALYQGLQVHFMERACGYYTDGKIQTDTGRHTGKQAGIGNGVGAGREQRAKALQGVCFPDGTLGPMGSGDHDTHTHTTHQFQGFS